MRKRQWPAGARPPWRSLEPSALDSPVKLCLDELIDVDEQNVRCCSCHQLRGTSQIVMTQISLVLQMVIGSLAQFPRVGGAPSSPAKKPDSNGVAEDSLDASRVDVDQPVQVDRVQDDPVQDDPNQDDRFQDDQAMTSDPWSHGGSVVALFDASPIHHAQVPDNHNDNSYANKTAAVPIQPREPAWFEDDDEEEEEDLLFSDDEDSYMAIPEAYSIPDHIIDAMQNLTLKSYNHRNFPEPARALGELMAEPTLDVPPTSTPCWETIYDHVLEEEKRQLSMSGQPKLYADPPPPNVSGTLQPNHTEFEGLIMTTSLYSRWNVDFNNDQILLESLEMMNATPTDLGIPKQMNDMVWTIIGAYKSMRALLKTVNKDLSSEQCCTLIALHRIWKHRICPTFGDLEFLQYHMNPEFFVSSPSLCSGDLNLVNSDCASYDKNILPSPLISSAVSMSPPAAGHHAYSIHENLSCKTDGAVPPSSSSIHSIHTQNMHAVTCDNEAERGASVQRCPSDT
jgi:hypothetical protein